MGANNGQTLTGQFEKIVHRQSEIISIQSGVIDELFSLLAQHITVEESGNLPRIERIYQAAKLRTEID